MDTLPSEIKLSIIRFVNTPNCVCHVTKLVCKEWYALTKESNTKLSMTIEVNRAFPRDWIHFEHHLKDPNLSEVCVTCCTLNDLETPTEEPYILKKDVTITIPKNITKFTLREPQFCGWRYCVGKVSIDWENRDQTLIAEGHCIIQYNPITKHLKNFIGSTMFDHYIKEKIKVTSVSIHTWNLILDIERGGHEEDDDEDDDECYDNITCEFDEFLKLLRKTLDELEYIEFYACDMDTDPTHECAEKLYAFVLSDELFADCSFTEDPLKDTIIVRKK